MRIKIIWLPLLLVLGFAAESYSQTNPTVVEFESPDHATVDSYELDLKICTTPTVCSTVVQTLTFTKASATVITGTNPVQYRASINVQPISFGQYVGVMRAVAAGVKSSDSVPSNIFVRAPGAPSKPVFK